MTDKYDIYNDGLNYMNSLLYDYEDYVKLYGYISVDQFLQNWTCIPHKTFSNLVIGNIVYDCNGSRYVVTDDAYESDNETLYVETLMVDNNGNIIQNSENVFSEGDLYSESITHTDYKWKKRKIESEEKTLCPILISKTNQHQS